MTTSPFATLEGQRCARVELHVPQRGAWHAVVDLETDPALPERCTLTLGEQLTLVGTIAGMQSGVFGQQRRVRLVAGGGGWGKSLAAKPYHNDAGVRAVLVAQDAARAVGETLGEFVPARERVGVDYVRDSARVASQVLEDVIGRDVLWWVDPAGLTQVGQRPTRAALQQSSYSVLAYDPRERMLTLSLDELAALQIGSVISSSQLNEAQRVREYEVHVDAEGLRVFAWVGGDERSSGRLAALWNALVARAESSTLTGLYRYRVVNMAADGRVSLQAARKAAGLPDIAPIAQWPGMAGVHAELAPGAEVLVAFVEGDRAQPVVTHYSGKGGEGFVPASIVIGGSSGPPAARVGDTVEVILPPGTFNGTLASVPPVALTGVIVWPLQTALGQIKTGSSKVSIA